MNTAMDTITSVEDRVVETLETIQQPVVDFVKQVVEQVEGFLPEDRPSLPFADLLPEPYALVENQYGFGKRILETQHQFAKALLDAVAPLYGWSAPAKPAAAKAASKAA